VQFTGHAYFNALEEDLIDEKELAKAMPKRNSTDNNNKYAFHKLVLDSNLFLFWQFPIIAVVDTIVHSRS
jgi:hypothetical protein